MASSYSPLSPVSEPTTPFDDEYLYYPYNADYMTYTKKDDQVPRCYPELKPSAVFIMPPRHAIHSPLPTHPLQPPTSFDVEDDGWNNSVRQFVHGHSLAQQQSAAHLGHYSSSADPSVPRIKQEELSGFSTGANYPELLHHPNSISYNTLNLQQQIQSHPNPTNPPPSSFQPLLLSPLRSHQPNPHHQSQSSYYSFHPQHIRSAACTSSPYHSYAPVSAPRSDPEQTPVSPLSAYPGITGVGIACDPHFVHHVMDDSNSKSAVGAWRDDRRSSLASIQSELSELEVMDIDSMVAVGPGVAVGGMPLGIDHTRNSVSHGSGVVGPEEMGGEEDAEGEDDCQYDQHNHSSQEQYQIVQQHYQQHTQQQYDDSEGSQQQQQHNDAPASHHTSEGEDEIEDLADSEARSDVSGDARNRIVAPTSPAAASAASASVSDEAYEFDDEEESDEDYEDPDDDEFVLPSRSRQRTSSTFPHSAPPSSGSRPEFAGGVPNDGRGFHYMTSEGRSLRPRSVSARYNPYPASSSSSSFETGFYDRNGQYRHPQEGHGGGNKRYASSTTSADSRSSNDGGETTTITTTLSASASASTSRRRLRPTPSVPIPIPVPNLTKKSRGRRVPTMSSLEDLRSASSGAGRKRQGAPSGKMVRMYLCEVEGCGKCFARGEHLKRHVRSIHTYEKPHRCMYPGCGKDFSRHDNLGQHMRVHKNFVPTARSATPSTTASPSPRDQPVQD